MSKVDGESLETVWNHFSLKNRSHIMSQIGKVMAEVQAVEVGELKTLTPDWEQFISVQVRGCKARHEKKGMPRWFLGELDVWVKDSLKLIEGDERRVILTGEYTPFNLLVEQDDGYFHLSGMIDFGDTMIGLPEYDLLGPSVFLAAGEPELVRALFESYGFVGEDSTLLRPKLMLLQILHRYSDFRSQLRIDGWEDKVKSIDELSELIWPVK